MEYEVRTRNLDEIYMSNFYDIVNWYEENKKSILDNKCYMYGCVLVSLKSVFCGIRFVIGFDSQHFSWMPKFYWKYNKYFSWLYLTIRLEYVYKNKVCKIIKDHIGESEVQ